MSFKVEPEGVAAKYGVKEGDMIARLVLMLNGSSFLSFLWSHGSFSVNGISLKYYVTRKEAVSHIKQSGAKGIITMELQEIIWNFLFFGLFFYPEYLPSIS